tara:strand:- start:54 stop:581 length:528 start_codon:yes stop_codon:yes gene_type:complete
MFDYTSDIEGRFYLTTWFVRFMGQVNGYIAILVGLFFILGAYGTYSESNELQAKHDFACGGVMEALLDWDGNCEELREYISTLKFFTVILGIIGIALVVSGNNEVKKAHEENKKKSKGVELRHYSTGKNVVKPFSALETLRSPTQETANFCGNCGTQFEFNSSENFCVNCGSPRK